MTKSASSEFDRNREDQEENKRMSAVQRKSIVLYCTTSSYCTQAIDRQRGLCKVCTLHYHAPPANTTPTNIRITISPMQ
eukprot:scaffold23641_cov88-Skeletonema_marinoi.AAC.1